MQPEDIARMQKSGDVLAMPGKLAIGNNKAESKADMHGATHWSEKGLLLSKCFCWNNAACSTRRCPIMIFSPAN
jgi:hypothetical protein